MLWSLLITAALATSDDDVLKAITDAAATADRARLETMASEIADPGLRGRTVSALDDFVRAGALSRRTRSLESDLKALKGVAGWEPGGPAWLRERVGDDRMKIFDRLVKVDLNDRTNPHAKDYRLNTTVNDAWLEKLAGLPDVRSLDIANTDVKGPGLRHVATLAALESLNLTLTPVTDEFLEPLAALTKLKVLGLASTQVTGTGTRALAALPIENLNCHNTPVNDAGLAEISKLKHLIRLEIVHCKFTDEGARHLASLGTLERLQMGSRAATGGAVAPLRELRLKELDLHDGQPVLAGLQAAGGIATLKVLRVYGGGAGDAGLAALGGLDRLETLILEGTGLTDAGLASLSGLKALKKVELGERKVTDPAVLELRKARPDLEVIRR